jgi:hypothetical protein
MKVVVGLLTILLVTASGQAADEPAHHAGNHQPSRWR